MLVHVIKPPELLLVDYCLFVIWGFMIVVSILLFSKKINNNKKLIIMNFTFFFWSARVSVAYRKVSGALCPYILGNSKWRRAWLSRKSITK